MNDFLRLRSNTATWAAFLLGFIAPLLPCVVHGQDSHDDEVPEDTCILELNLPEGATVTIDGHDYGTQRRLRYDALQPGRTYTSRLRVAFADGTQRDRTLLIQGGQRVGILLPTPAAKALEPVVQIGHNAWVWAAAISPDGRHIVTGASDRKAILWDTLTARQIRTLEGHAGCVHAVAFGRDGREVLTGSCDRTAVLWDAASGTRLRTFPLLSPNKEAARGIGSVAFSPDRRHILTDSGGDKTAILWDLATGKRVHVLRGHEEEVRAVAFSPDGRWALTGSKDRTAILWDAATGKRIRSLGPHPDLVNSLAFSPDGRRVLSGSPFMGKTAHAILWDVSTGASLRGFRCYEDSLGLPKVGFGTLGGTRALAFSPDGRRIVTASPHFSAILWDVATGEKLRVFEGHKGAVYCAIFTPDGKRVFTTSWDKTAILWDVQTGECLHVFEGCSNPVGAIAVSPDGARLAVGCGSLSVWNLSVGTKLPGFEGHDEAVESVVFSPDGSRVLTGSENEKAVLWDANTGGKLLTFHIDHDASLVSFASDKRKVLLGGSEETTAADPTTGVIENHLATLRTKHLAFDSAGRKVLVAPLLTLGFWQTLPEKARPDLAPTLWDVGTGKKLREFYGHLPDEEIICGAISPDGQYVLTAGVKENVMTPGQIILWNVMTGKMVRRLQGHQHPIRSVAFSRDGRYVCTGHEGGVTIVWDADTGRALRTLGQHAGGITTLAVTPDSRRLLTGSRDGSVAIWDIASGQDLVRIVSLEGGREWLAFTGEGFFDGSGGAREKVMFRVGGGLNVVPVDRFFQDFYYPGLLAAIWRGERPLPAVEIGQSLPPTVRIVEPERGYLIETSQVIVEVEAADQGGGVRGPWLMQNGARVLAPGHTEREGNVVRRTLQVALVEGENKLEFHAASADGSWESEPAVITLRYERPLPKPELYLVSVGVNRYAQESMNLEFAVPDAQAMAGLFQQRGPDLYASVDVTTLLDEQASAAAILHSVRGLAQKARPQDTLVVFLAGHGTVVGQRYYFLPHEFRRQAKTLEEDIRAQGLSESEIQDALVAVPALKRVVIFDTGQSGGEVGLTRTARDPFAFRGAIERLSRASGAFTIAAAATSDQAQEVSELGHGVLTYTLLAGLHAAEGGPLEDQWVQPKGKDRVADVLEWFGFASTHVPRLTKQYFGQQQEVQHSIRPGTSFPVLPVPALGKPAEVLAADSVALARPERMPLVRGVGQGKLHLVAVGINRYQDETMNLKFARSDATAMVELFRGRGLWQYGEVDAKQVLDEQATKEGILKALEQVGQEVQPEDTLVVFVSGHGKMVGQRYYFIPHEFARQRETVEADIRQQGLAVDVLADAVSKVAAKKRLLIFDTCASGGALSVSRLGEDPFAFRGAIERLGQQEGVFTIAASAAGQEAQEIKELGHGVLTYALLAGLSAVPPEGPLEGMAIQPSSPDGSVDVLEWFSFASGHVPRLTKQYLRREQQVHISGHGTSFPVLPVREQ